MVSKNVEGTPENYAQLYCSDRENAKIWFFGAPLDKTTTFLKGTGEGPQAIRKAMIQTEEYDITTGKNILDVGFFDLGDIKFTGSGEIEKIKTTTMDIIKNKKTPVMFGGEHTVTIGVVTALKESMKGLKVISLDAHADLRESFEFDKFNHACVMKRVADAIGKENILELGIRSMAEEETEFIDRIILRRSIRENFEAAKKRIEEFAKDSNVYITIDMDAFDPSFAPGVGTPEPDGLSYNEAFELVKCLKSAKKIIGMDIVELRPIENSSVTEMTASKFMFESIMQLKEKL